MIGLHSSLGTSLSNRGRIDSYVLEKLQNYLDKRSREIPAETLLGKAVSYMLNQWDKTYCLF
jgi:hypothetical protein